MKAFKIVLALAILLTGLLTLNACQALNAPLEDYTWILTSYGTPGNLNTPLEGTEINIFFNSGTKQFNGSSGCNQYNGTYKVDGLTLTIDDSIITTKIACSDVRNEQERNYLEALKAAQSFKLDHGNLIIYCGTEMMNFRRQQE